MIIRTLVLLALITACSSDNVTSPKTDNGSGWFGTLLQDDLEPIVAAKVDTSNLNCVVIIENITSEIIDWDSSYYVPVYVDHSALTNYAPSVPGGTLLTPFVLNGTAFDSEGRAFGNGRTGLKTYFEPGNTANTISKPDPDPAVGVVKETTLVFGSGARFANVRRGDILRSDTSQVFSFYGAGDYNVLTLLVHTPKDPSTNKDIGFAKSSTSEAPFTISKDEMANIAEGYAMISVSSYQIKSVKSSNGAVVLVLAVTKHVIEVEIK
ncbi:MAG: hypothetical protein EHM43_04355 [Ignavibacteriae bacterium]|nr:MAG: hypothetical protein EHM43_04355 [Ignavibacteriota bacterium]